MSSHEYVESEPEECAEPRSARRVVRTEPDAGLLAALHRVADAGSSDLHVAADATPRWRVNGRLEPLPGETEWSREHVASILFSLLSPAQLEAFEAEQELDFSITLDARARFRVNLYQQRDAVGAAFRLIPTDIKPLSSLGLPKSIGEFARLPRGLVLVTGPTGSGKSTTLAAIIDLVNRTRADHIITVEDPIEFLHTNKLALVNQREVGTDTKSFTEALKRALRQDPDVILVGELRDLETISVALTAAETGHLVFATLHTQDAPQTIDRVIDVFPASQQAQVRTMLADTLKGVVSQTLVRRAGGEGRVVATEILVSTPAIANLIREGKTHQIPTVMQSGSTLGMHTLDQSLAELVNTQVVTSAAALAKARDREGLKGLLRREDAVVSLGIVPETPTPTAFADTFARVTS